MTSLTSPSSAGRALGAPAPLATTLAGAPAASPAAGAPIRRAATPAGAKVLPPRAAKAGAAAAKKPTTSKKKTASKAGYAKASLPAEFAFLRDPKLSIEEKLSRFCGLIMAKAEKDLLAQMERMAPGAKTSAAGGAGGTGGAPPKKKSGGLWGALKIILPQVGMAATLLGDAATKKLVQQVSGPVLAAAATALGMPQLAPVALQAGSILGKVVTDDQRGAAAAVGAAIDGVLRDAGAGILGVSVASTAAAASGGTGGSSGTGGTGGSGATKAAADEPRSEKADQLELQRLMEREKETFTLLSNILRMNHEARMASVQNIR